jgi:streptogramin lyase
MPERMDGFERWLQQRLAATVEDAARVPRRRLLLPGATARGAHPRRDGFLAGMATAAVLFGVVWAGIDVGLHRNSHSAAPSKNAGRIVSSVDVSDPVFAVAAGEGGVWVPDGKAGTLLRIDPRSGRVVATIRIRANVLPGSGTIEAVTTSPGAVWVTSQADDELLRIDPSANTVAQRIPLGLQPNSIAVLGNDIWVTGSKANRVLRIALASGAVEATVNLTDPGAMAAGDGGVWVVSEREGVLSRIDPATNRAQAVYTAAASLDYVVDAVTAVDDGAWVRNLDAQSIAHVDTLTGEIIQHAPVGGPPALFPQPFSIASTDSAIWVTINSALVRVDRRTLQVTTLPMVDPTGITVAGDGTLWLATAQSRVVHVAPP